MNGGTRVEALSVAFRQHRPVLLVFSLALLVYLFTLAPTVFSLDSAELSTASYRLGIPHSTGYPLYVMLGKLFTFLPVGDVGYRLNLMSAIFAAGAVAALYGVALVLTRRVLVSLATALFFAFSYYFWTSSVIAEVYTLHTMLTGVVLLLLLMWDRHGDRRFLYGAVGVWGLSFGNHMSTALLAPAIGYLLLMSVFRKTFVWRDALPLTGLFLVTLLTYAYLPLRYLAGADVVVGEFDGSGLFNKVNLASVEGMWWMLSGEQFHVFFFPYDFMGAVGELGRYLYWLLGNFLGVGVVFGLIGMVHQAISAPRQFVFLLLAFVANVAFFVNYGPPDKDTMFIPTYLVWGVWMACGIAYVVTTLQRHRPTEPLRPLRASGDALARFPWEGAALILPIVAFAVNFSYADVSSDREIRDRSASILTSLDDNALVVGWWPDMSPMFYLQQVEGVRRDVWLIDRFLITRENEAQLIDRIRHERPVYVFGHLPNVQGPYEVEPFWHGHSLVWAATPG